MLSESDRDANKSAKNVTQKPFEYGSNEAKVKSLGKIADNNLNFNTRPKRNKVVNGKAIMGSTVGHISVSKKDVQSETESEVDSNDEYKNHQIVPNSKTIKVSPNNANLGADRSTSVRVPSPVPSDASSIMKTRKNRRVASSSS